MVRLMSAIGVKISKMGLEKKLGQMERDMKVHTDLGLNMEKGIFHGQMAQVIKENFKITT